MKKISALNLNKNFEKVGEVIANGVNLHIFFRRAEFSPTLIFVENNWENQAATKKEVDVVAECHAGFLMNTGELCQS